MNSIFQKGWAVAFFAIFCTFLWGSAFPVLKISFVEWNIAPTDIGGQLVFAGMRFLLAGLIILFYLFITDRKKLRIKRSHIPVVISLGFIQTSLQYLFFYNGLIKVTGILGAIINSSGVFLTILLAHFFYKNDKLNWQKTVGLVVGFAGIVAANWQSDFQFQFQLTGEGFMILAGLAFAVGSILSKNIATEIDPIPLTGWQLTIGSVILLLVGLPMSTEEGLTVTPVGSGLLLYAAILSALAFTIWTTLLKYNRAGQLSIYNFLNPIFGALLSALFIPGEQFNLFLLAGLILVSFGIIAANYQGKSELVTETSVQYKRSWD